jgi:carbon-monoxide dehydrogenase small subunit
MERAFRDADGGGPAAAGGPSTVRLGLTVNGRAVVVEVAPDRFLIDVLRDDLELVGTKLGCEIGVCGLCAVIVDGQLQSACLIPAVLAAGTEIETVEGLAGPGGELTAVQEAFIEHGAFQCGICTPGQIVTATSLLRERPHPTESDVTSWMMGSLCRCTGYEGIREAILALAGDRAGA